MELQLDHMRDSDLQRMSGGHAAGARLHVRGVRLGCEGDGVRVARRHGPVGRVEPRLLLFQRLVGDGGVVVVPRQVLLVQDFLPVGSVEQDEEAGLGGLEQRVEQREHVQPADQLRREGQLQDGGAQLHVLAAGLQGDGPAAAGRQVEERGQAVPGRVARHGHEHRHGVHSRRDGGQELRAQHDPRHYEEHHQAINITE
ncbi:hypothetical protein ANANG_G00074690, partial [Anguilla anguilla]